MWKDMLLRAATSTFEDAAFCMVEGVGEGGMEIGPARGVVSFQGPRSGLLMVEAENATAAAATANMLGLDEEPSADLRQDALFELANMICGQIVSASGDGHDLYRLTRRELDAEAAGDPDAEMVLSLDCGLARVALWISPDVASEAR
jgi:Chemotaxis phosphatase CheX